MTESYSGNDPLVWDLSKDLLLSGVPCLWLLEPTSVEVGQGPTGWLTGVYVLTRIGSSRLQPGLVVLVVGSGFKCLFLFKSNNVW